MKKAEQARVTAWRLSSRAVSSGYYQKSRIGSFARRPCLALYWISAPTLP